MPLDKFHRYVDACTRKELEDRKSYTIDTMAAIASAFSKDGLQKYLKTLDESYK